MGKNNLRKKKILLVDDDMSVSKMLSLLLETRGYSIEIAVSGKEALQKVNDTTDLILLDIVLPDQEGFDVCRKLKEKDRTRHIPIIILSAKLLSEDIVEGLYLGADDYLTKPFEYEELVARMEAVMRRGSIFNHGKNGKRGDDSIICELRNIIDNELIVPFYQPIFLLKPFSLLGFEALCRPKSQSILADPELLFKAALQYGLYHEMELLSWKKAIEGTAAFLKDEKLFLNCNPYLVEGPKFLTVKTLFENCSIDINNIVLEITERSEVTDYKGFYDNLGRFREMGLKFAVDDVGGGYSSLESIVETKPEVVKIDRHIINNLREDRFKKSIVKFVVAFCKDNNILSIAEGIENRKDLEVVIDLGVDAAQGYFLYRPSAKISHEEVSKVEKACIK